MISHIKLFFSFIFLFFFILTCLLWIVFDPYQFNFQFLYISDLGAIGLDGLSLLFLYLTSLICLLSFINSFNKDPKYHLYLISIEILLFFCFLVLDFFFFYIFFELVLLPFLLFIGISGYKNRKIHATYLLFFYTIFGSFLMLLSIFLIYLHSGTTDLQMLWCITFSWERECFIWIFLFFSLCVKIPIFPFHLWLPEAHVESPTEGSALLAGVLLKLGGYGFLRFLLPIFPISSFYFSPIVLVLASLSVIYSSFIALRQIDIKRIIAYSSIAHMNFCIMGLFSFNTYSICGSIFLMFGHGIVSSCLFFLIGVVYSRYHTKLVYYYKGLVYFMPLFSFFFFFMFASNVSFPGSVNFIGEFLIVTGLFYNSYFFILFLGLVGVFLCTVYSFILYNKIFFSFFHFYKEKKNIFYDILKNEMFIFVILTFHCLLFGLYPNLAFDIFYQICNFYYLSF